MSVHGPISSDIAAQANVGVQGNNGSRRRKRQTTLVTHKRHGLGIDGQCPNSRPATSSMLV
jgi:hypothetical protein